MIDVTRLLCGRISEAEHLRYPDAPTKRRAPAVVVWNCTRRCNLHCVHCYSESRDTNYAGELTTAEAKKMIDDLASFGVAVLLFSGGEPLMRADLFELGAYAGERGIRPAISTNGTLVTGEKAAHIHQAGFKYVGVSLDGIEATNDAFRGVEGAFAKALGGIRNTMSAGVKAGVRFTVTRRNAQDLEGIFDLLERDGIPRMCIYHLVYAGRGSELRKEDLARDETRAALDRIFARTEQMPDREILTVDNPSDGVYLYLTLRRRDRARAEEAMRLLSLNGGNGSGESIGCVDENGDVHADQFWRHYSVGNVRNAPFSQIWTGGDALLAGLRNRTKLIKGRCRECHYLPVCRGGLRVRAEAVFGDAWAEEPACRLTDEEIHA